MASHTNQTARHPTPLHGRADILTRLIANIGAALPHVKAAPTRLVAASKPPDAAEVVLDSRPDSGLAEVDHALERSNYATPAPRGRRVQPSTPMCNFMPEYRGLRLWIRCVSGSGCDSVFLVELGGPMIVA